MPSASEPSTFFARNSAAIIVTSEECSKVRSQCHILIGRDAGCRTFRIWAREIAVFVLCSGLLTGPRFAWGLPSRGVLPSDAGTMLSLQPNLLRVVFRTPGFQGQRWRLHRLLLHYR